MNNSDLNLWLDALRGTVSSYRKMIDATLLQLSDGELHTRPADNFNSVATILRHLGGNLKSRWTDFLTTDGEKPDRNRDAEFLDWQGDRQSLLDYFDGGWSALIAAIDSINPTNIHNTIKIRGEAHTIAQALVRSINHLSYHVGQLVLIGRMVHAGQWHWMTIPPGSSAEFNSRTWGTPSSRGVAGDDPSSKS